MTVLNNIESKETCICCGKSIYYDPEKTEYNEGCIYSIEGLKEFRNSSLCEYCFDNIIDEAYIASLEENEISLLYPD